MGTYDLSFKGFERDNKDDESLFYYPVQYRVTEVEARR